jgi:hypothetical protein
MGIEYLARRPLSADDFLESGVENRIIRSTSLNFLPKSAKEQNLIMSAFALSEGNEFTNDRAMFGALLPQMVESVFRRFVPQEKVSVLEIGPGPVALSTSYLPPDRLEVVTLLEGSQAYCSRLAPVARKNGWNLINGDIHLTTRQIPCDVAYAFSSFDSSMFLDELFANLKRINPKYVLIYQDVWPNPDSILGLEFRERKNRGYINLISCGMAQEHLIWIKDWNNQIKTSFEYLQDMQEKYATKAGFKVKFKGVVHSFQDIEGQSQFNANNVARYFTYFEPEIPGRLRRISYYADLMVLEL